MSYSPSSNITTTSTDAEIDFNKLVVIQMNRCNIELSQGSYRFSTAVMSFSCMLSHLRQRDDYYKKDIKELENDYKKQLKEIKDKQNYDRLLHDIQLRAAVKEYEILVRLCARHNLFPRKRGNLDDDDD